MSDSGSNDEDVQVAVLQKTVEQTERLKGYQFEPRRSRPNQIVKVCIAMMLSLIFLTGTPSNRTSRSRLARVAGWHVTMSYNELLTCNPGCNPVCNTGAPGRFCQEVSRVIRIGCPLRQTGAWAEGGLCAGKCMLNPCSNYDDA